MPDFPRYQSKGQLTTQAPSVGAPEDTTGEIIQKVGEVGKTVQDASLKWSNAVDTIQKTTAKANFKTGVLDVQNNFQNNPNPTIDDYNNSLKEIEKLRSKSLDGFTSPLAQSEAALDFDYDAKVAGIQLENSYKKKMIDVGQASTLKLIDTEVNNPTDSSFGNIENLLNAQVNAGIIGHEDSYKLLQKANHDLGVNRINKDLYMAQTPDQVDAVTQGITSGAYEKGGVTIDPDKKKALLDIADRARTNTEKKIQAQQAEAMTQNRMETIVGLASGEISFDSLDMKDIAEYDPQLAGTLTKVKDFMVNYNPKLPPKEQSLSSAGLLSTSHVMQMKGYARSITDTFLQDDNQKLSEFLMRELDKKSDGLTSSVKLAAFANLAALKSKVNNQQNVQDSEGANRYNAIKSAVKFLETSNPYLFPYVVGEFLVRDFLSGASSQEEVMEEARATLRDKIIDKHKSVSKLPTLPNKIVDGEASVEDLSAGLNDFKDGESSASYADQTSD